MHDKNVTIYDIAKEAGVSPATVSRVLTGSARVSSVKKDKILEIIEKYNFQPNAFARGLINKESKTIGFILPDITNPFFSAVFIEAEKRALSLGYTVILCNSMNDNMMNQNNIESLYLGMLCEKQVDGIIIMGGRTNEKITDVNQANELAEINKKTPIVIINGNMKGVDSHNIIADEKDGVYNLIKYLVSLGHKNLGFIGGRKGVTSTDVKLNAFNKAIKHFQLNTKHEWIIPSSFSIKDGYDSMKALLSLKEIPTAVLAVNDFTAVGAIQAAEENGIRVPEDISITGFDNIYLTDIIKPRITTVSQNYTQLGQLAIDTIVGIANNSKLKKKVIVSTQLIIKDSCKAIK